MPNILMLVPTTPNDFAASRGSGAANLLTPDPREVWQDSAVGSAATLDIDFGVATAIDTVFLGCIWNAVAGATWTISGGLAGYGEFTIQAASALRVADRAGRTSAMSHAFWHGDDVLARYVRIAVTQPAGEAALAIGALLAGLSFVPMFNQEWGAGRGVKDTGTFTRLPTGGISVVEGARYGSYRWTLGDLTTAEADYLYDLQLDRGETRPMLVVEDPGASAGLRSRIHYGGLVSLRAFERRNPAQTRWEFQIEDWSTEGDVLCPPAAPPVLTLTGEPLSLGGEILTIGA